MTKSINMNIQHEDQRSEVRLNTILSTSHCCGFFDYNNRSVNDLNVTWKVTWKVAWNIGPFEKEVRALVFFKIPCSQELFCHQRHVHSYSRVCCLCQTFAWICHTCIWSPSYANAIQLIELVHCKFNRTIPGFTQLSRLIKSCLSRNAKTSLWPIKLCLVR